MIRIEWHDEKATENYLKHRIRFEDAKSVFDDSLAVTKPNSIVNGEERWQTTGLGKTGILLFVIHTIQENGTEIIRIISARKPTTGEREDYELG